MSSARKSRDAGLAAVRRAELAQLKRAQRKVERDFRAADKMVAIRRQNSERLLRFYREEHEALLGQLAQDLLRAKAAHDAAIGKITNRRAKLEEALQ